MFHFSTRQASVPSGTPTDVPEAERQRSSQRLVFLCKSHGPTTPRSQESVRCRSRHCATPQFARQEKDRAVAPWSSGELCRAFSVQAQGILQKPTQDNRSEVLRSDPAPANGRPA